MRLLLALGVMTIYIGRYFEPPGGVPRVRLTPRFKCKYSDCRGLGDVLGLCRLKEERQNVLRGPSAQDDWGLWVSKDMHPPLTASYSLTDFILNGFFRTVPHSSEPFWTMPHKK